MFYKNTSAEPEKALHVGVHTGKQIIIMAYVSFYMHVVKSHEYKSHFLGDVLPTTLVCEQQSPAEYFSSYYFLHRCKNMTYVFIASRWPEEDCTSLHFCCPPLH